MDNLFRGVVAVTGCVLFAGACLAEETNVRDQAKASRASASSHVKAAPPSSKVVTRWARGKVYPEPVKEMTRDTLKGKRPR